MSGAGLTEETVERVCPECGLALDAGAHECPSCGCSPCGTGLVDHLPPADNDNRLAPVALAAATLVAGEVLLLAVAPVAGIVVAAAVVLGVAAWAMRRGR